MNKERCGSCPDCTSEDPVWCFQWGEPTEQDLVAMSDEQFGRVSRMMRGHHHTVVEAEAVPDPKSKPLDGVEVRGSVGGSMAPSLYGAGVSGSVRERSVPRERTGEVPAISTYVEKPLPPVQTQDPSSRQESTTTYTFTVTLPVTSSGLSHARELERKREEVQRMLRVGFHDESIVVRTKR